MSEADIKALAREVAALLSPDALMTTEDVASLLRCAPRYVTEGYAKRPGFPKAVCLPGPKGKPGHPRYLRRQITEFIESLVVPEVPVAKQSGRPRKNGVTP